VRAEAPGIAFAIGDAVINSNPAGYDMQVEYWRWRFRDPQTGRICRTTFALTEEEAASKYPGSEPIEGTRSVREINPAKDEPKPAPLVARSKPGSEDAAE
jgi:hypothetical protein